ESPAGSNSRPPAPCFPLPALNGLRRRIPRRVLGNIPVADGRELLPSGRYDCPHLRFRRAAGRKFPSWSCQRGKARATRSQTHFGLHLKEHRRTVDAEFPGKAFLHQSAEPKVLPCLARDPRASTEFPSEWRHHRRSEPAAQRNREQETAAQCLHKKCGPRSVLVPQRRRGTREYGWSRRCPFQG